ncbi:MULTISPECIES: FlhC family transcriptional regulator [unclassified Methylocaldum]|jgi:hypothetical protein|uniref:FlhC family transcriptional regulator n=1 Tax=unclassified Methylocaldum TaxID=2622260 RepID=UPI00111C4BF8|nr:FlhC family transcriptional regulator [Methylocaldum sp. RMAD-M]MBP1151357.1 hypothetical protein [Methylocaldum sp. RMAD-M]MVF23995.1 transcriptional regulator [Methylocaldum sp. BRCS4]
MCDESLSFTDRLADQKLACELIVRRLRIPYVFQAVRSLTVEELREMHRCIHQGEGPPSGPSPRIQSIPNNRASMVYLSAFASLYLKASALDNRQSVDAKAVIAAWDLFHECYPNALRFRRPFGKVRPANITEAWVLAQALRCGLAHLRHCPDCHGEYLVIEDCKLPPVCQYCALGFAKRRGASFSMGDDVVELPVLDSELPQTAGDVAPADDEMAA